MACQALSMMSQVCRASADFCRGATKLNRIDYTRHQFYRYRYIRCKYKGAIVPTLLHITVSPRGNHSISRQLGVAAVREWQENNPGGRVVERDLAKTPLSFVDCEWIVGAFSPPETHTQGHKRALAISDELISELQQADEIILDTPMYNF